MFGIKIKSSTYKYHLRLLSFIIMAYMLLVFGWWSILLFNQNSNFFESEVEKLRIIQASEGAYVSESTFKQGKDYLEIYDRYMRKQWMIFGEALFFVGSILIAIWLMNRGYNDLVKHARQQRNFLLSITHELKSPLASIQLGLETIIKRDLDQEKVKQVARHVLTENERLRSLVDNLLLAAKLESSYDEVYEDTDIALYFKEIIQTLEPRLEDANIIYGYENADLIVQIDRSSLEYVIRNLIENAYKYSPDEKYIRIIIRDLDADSWEFSVEDRGIGIPDDEKEHIYEKFYRIGSEDTRQTKGTGIGLYIIDNVIKSHNGSVVIQDVEPKGTIFKINLPKYQNSNNENIARRR